MVLSLLPFKTQNGLEKNQFTLNARKSPIAASTMMNALRFCLGRAALVPYVTRQRHVCSAGRQQHKKAAQRRQQHRRRRPLQQRDCATDWPPQLRSEENACQENACQVLLELGASKDDLLPMKQILQRLRDLHPAAYPLVVKCGVWPAGSQHGPPLAPARMLLILVPWRQSQLQGWQLAHLPVQLDAADGCAPSGQRFWNSGHKFVASTSLGLTGRNDIGYKNDCRVLAPSRPGRRPATLTVGAWVTDAFGDQAIPLKHGSRAGQQYLLQGFGDLPPPAAQAATSSAGASSSGTGSAGTSSNSGSSSSSRGPAGDGNTSSWSTALQQSGQWQAGEAGPEQRSGPEAQAVLDSLLRVKFALELDSNDATLQTLGRVDPADVHAALLEAGDDSGSVLRGVLRCLEAYYEQKMRRG